MPIPAFLCSRIAIYARDLFLGFYRDLPRPVEGGYGVSNPL